MTTPPRDWNKELAAIDRAMAKSPPVPQSQSPSAPARGAPALAAPTRRSAFGTWLRVLLGVLLAGAMTQWPYASRCGTFLFLYFGAAGVVVLAGFWGSISSWRRRLGLAHVISLLVTLWGLGLAAAVLLPRTGYAREQLSWFCP